MLIISTIIIPALSSSSIKAAAETPWTSLASMPTARAELGVVAVNGKIYAIGGSNGGAPLNINERYDPVLNQWTTAAPMPTARSEFAIAVFNGKIYVFGGTIGNGFVSNTEVYDPLTNTWETRASMPTPRADLCACVVHDKIYLIGGKKYSSNPPYYAETGVTEIYDPALNTWSTGPPMINDVFSYASGVMDSKIYIVGGTKTSGSSTTIFSDSTQVYNPDSNRWTVAANLPNMVTYGAAAATQGYMAPSKLYFIGGYVSNNCINNTLIYNSNNDTWTYGPSMPTARASMGIAVLDDILYVVGGYNGTNWLGTVEKFTPIGYGTVPPQIRIISPENRTYAKVNLAFSVNRETAWIAYSLDNQANVTISGRQIPLQNLSQGSHKIVIYVNDTLGNMGVSNTVYFSIDSKAPNITILVPQNQTYSSTDIHLTFYLDEATKILAYSLDGAANVTIIGNVTLPALSNGAHNLTLYATDDVGNAGSQTVYFTIEPFPMLQLTAIIVFVIIIVSAGYLLVKRRKTERTDTKVPLQESEK